MNHGSYIQQGCLLNLLGTQGHSRQAQTHAVRYHVVLQYFSNINSANSEAREAFQSSSNSLIFFHSSPQHPKVFTVKVFCLLGQIYSKVLFLLLGMGIPPNTAVLFSASLFLAYREGEACVKQNKPESETPTHPVFLQNKWLCLKIACASIYLLSEVMK